MGMAKGQRVRPWQEMGPCVSHLRIVRELHEEMVRQGVGPAEMERRAGISHDALHSWFRRRVTPSLALIEACWGVLGKRLEVVDME